MEYVVCGWPEDGPTLRLDYREFGYAGKFVMSQTGKAVARECDAATRDADDESEFEEGVVAAVAFNEDRTDPDTLWLRYITVRNDRRGEGIGARLAAFATERAAARGYDRLRIAVNNPFAYEALYKVGFGYTGRETGLAELVLERPADRPTERSRASYHAGLDVYRERDLSDGEQRFLASRSDAEPPAVIGSPT
ncbi:GNAT family N-acetyltransferase [Halococcus agarilyticus]|uniref:GNAT family N-acetyltransferase n=1 Tax=Halococcus agarilyticus TaxID=1232219 RepID=UPI0006782103|nr:GNAT family N-acetyltransferase [Halococcus agarilyticus]